MAYTKRICNIETYQNEHKYVRLCGQPYIHTCRSYVWPVRMPMSPAPWLPSVHLRAGQPWRRQFVRFWASGGAKFPKMGDSRPWTLMNRRAKSDAASFILGGEICNRTNKQTNTRTVNDISTLCLSACAIKSSRL